MHIKRSRTCTLYIFYSILVRRLFNSKWHFINNILYLYAIREKVSLSHVNF